MTYFVGLDVSQKSTSICVVGAAGVGMWRGICVSAPEQLAEAIRSRAGNDARIGLETGPMTPWLIHELRGRGLEVVCLDARHARAALKMQLNKTNQNDAEGLAHIMRTGWFRAVHVKSFDSHKARSLLGARIQLVGMTTRLSNHKRPHLTDHIINLIYPLQRRGHPQMTAPAYRISSMTVLVPLCAGARIRTKFARH